MVDMSEMRNSRILKGRKQLQQEQQSKLPPPVASEGATAMSSYVPDGDVTLSSNGQQPHTKQEDHYGFLYSTSEADMHYNPSASLPPEKSRERESKWLKMLHYWDTWMERKHSKVKERCRKGIPSSLRGRAWLRLSGAYDLMNRSENQGKFDELTSKPDNDVVLNVIDKDLDRTFPTHVLFQKSGSQGQADLRKVLKAYAMHNEKTGYCQAMAPVAATLLMNMTAEESFWCLVQICEQYLPGYYSPGLHAFQIDARILKTLLTKHLPAIKTWMDSKLPPNPDGSQKGLDPMLYCTEWFMSIFSRSLPWPTVLRVWDMFFFEGVKVLYKVALAVLNLAFSSPASQKECPGFFELTRKLRNLPIAITHEDILIPEVLRYKLGEQELRETFQDQAGIHFAEERVRKMELEARRAKMNSLSAASNTATSNASKITRL